jgi:putative membrane protein
MRAGRPTPLQAGCFAAGLLLLAMALVSPLCRLAASLAAAHMVQHVLIVAAAPPLLIIGSRHATTPPAGRGDHAALAAGCYAAAIWLSHLPAVYQAALREPAVHLLLLTGQLAAGLWFWQVVLRAALAPGAAPNARSGGALLGLFATFMHTSLLGALLTFASAPWYPIYQLRPQAWGLSPLEDQQLAGVIMWVPMSALYLAAGLALMARLLARPAPAAHSPGS